VGVVFAAYYIVHFLVRTPGGEGNAEMLDVIGLEARRRYGDWQLYIIPPVRTRKMVDYPAVRFMAWFESNPIRTLHASGLVIVWFQDQPWQVPDDNARYALEHIDWDRRAKDYEC
jgi:hypothetical protein